MSKITKTQLRQFLSAPSPDRDTYIREHDGFGVRRFKGSGRASFIVEARIRNSGRVQRTTIGPAQPELLDEARDKARVIHARLRSGENVNKAAAEKLAIERRQRITLRTAFEQMLQVRTFKDETARTYRHTIKHAGALNDRRITDLSIDQLRNRLREVEGEHPATAAKLKRCISTVINFAITEYAIPIVNPMTQIKGIAKAVQGRTSFVPEYLIGRFVDQTFKLQKVNPTHGNYIWFVLLTGCRKNEAMKLRWSDVDDNDNTLQFVDTKNGHTLKLPITCGISMLLTAQRGIVRNEFVFPGRTAGTHLTDVRTSVQSAYDEELRKYTLHDLRRTAATHMRGVGIGKDRVSAILNHRPRDITERYIQVAYQSVLDDMENYQNWLLRSTDNLEATRARQRFLSPTLAHRLRRMGVDPSSFEEGQEPSLLRIVR